MVTSSLQPRGSGTTNRAKVFILCLWPIHQHWYSHYWTLMQAYTDEHLQNCLYLSCGIPVSTERVGHHRIKTEKDKTFLEYFLFFNNFEKEKWNSKAIVTSLIFLIWGDFDGAGKISRDQGDMKDNASRTTLADLSILENAAMANKLYNYSGACKGLPN